MVPVTSRGSSRPKVVFNTELRALGAQRDFIGVSFRKRPFDSAPQSNIVVMKLSSCLPAT